MLRSSLKTGLLALLLAPAGFGQLQVKTAQGMLEGTAAGSIRMFRGVPFAQPPVGDLRWKAPQPPQAWKGVRKADGFGPRAMQLPLFGDMNFRSDGMAEDCLYLNIWTPDKARNLPVLVYFYGGGLQAGDGSEPRYDGESMAQRGIVSVTVNYRLNVFGFLAHPELSAESPQKASGNYGLLDQWAALLWVQQNIAAFGGDPTRVTIAGESAGSMSVSAQMASPLSKNLFARAIGESGSLLGTFSPVPLAQAEASGKSFAEKLGAASLAELRALPAEKVLEGLKGPNTFRFGVTVDGYFFRKAPIEVYQAGEQASVPLLVGWNSQEMTGKALLGADAPTIANFEKAVRKAYPQAAQAEEVLKLYGPKTEAEAEQAATDLAGDRFLGFSTWKWYEMQRLTGGQPVYRYYYSRPRPQMVAAMGDAQPGLAGGVIKGDGTGRRAPADRGAVHSAEIEYALGNLGSNRVYEWQPEDFAVSGIMQGFFANFIKTGNPNGPGLPKWLPATRTSVGEVMHIDVNTRSLPETHRNRYEWMDKLTFGTRQ